ncbi:hypothetical protein RHSIM_Rhsim04G0110100 [Rhododendron simsii]|uniref:Uncharacterized protein n=1 Tax=Rhododendron simsii TaxID=118357 RepID=A0A834LLY7_RHOSS|nr:hypothetical protein RHSIM_Rhsim04G0110100 [Rhododendron simsii]
MEGSSSSQLPAVAVSMDGSVTIEIEEHRSKKWPKSIVEEETKYPSSGLLKPKIQSYNQFNQVQPLERLKMSLVQQYVAKRKLNIDELYEKVVKVASDARKCYAEGLTEKFNDEEFTHMMFLDGCFTLNYICSIVEGNEEDLNKIQQIALVRRDLLLLENQLPFLVLRVLMRASFGIAQGEEMIIAFIKRIRGEPPKAVVLMEQIKYFIRQHSLGLKSHPEVQTQDGKDKDDDEPVHLLELVRRQFIVPKDFGIGCVISSNWYSRRSANDFKTVGIHCKPSRTNQFTAIEFKSKCTFGILTLPRIIVDDTTKSLLLNLAAYEACPDYANDLGVTSYICFMGSFIDQDEDVKELRSKGIVMNYLGSDKDVADLFRDTSIKLAPSPHAYLQVKFGIEKFHRRIRRKRIATWVSEVKRDYFRNPWTTIAVFYAVVVLFLSFIQTYFTVFPSPGKG